MKRALSILAAAMLVFSMGSVAYAEDVSEGVRQYVTENTPPEDDASEAIPVLGLDTETDPAVSGVIGSPAVLKDVRMVHEDNQHLMIKTFEVPPDFDPAGLTEADFKKNGYSYKMSYLLQVSENYSHESKLASQTVTITHKEQDEAVAKLAPLLDYSEGGFSGQLTLNLDSIFTEPSDQSSYTYRLTETREYTGFERNDTYGVPKTVNKGGATLQLVDVSWTPMGDGRYNAEASYAGTATGSTVNDYQSTATYVGQVNKDVLESVTYAVVYEGSAIPLPPPDYWPYILATVLVCALAGTGVVLFVRRKNCKILAYFGGRYNVVQRLRLNYYDPIIDLTHTSLDSREYLVVIDRWASKRLAGQSVRIICADGTVKEHYLEGSTYGCKLRLDSEEFHGEFREAAAQA